VKITAPPWLGGSSRYSIGAGVKARWLFAGVGVATPTGRRRGDAAQPGGALAPRVDSDRENQADGEHGVEAGRGREPARGGCVCAQEPQHIAHRGHGHGLDQYQRAVQTSTG